MEPEFEPTYEEIIKIEDQAKARGLTLEEYFSAVKESRLNGKKKVPMRTNKSLSEIASQYWDGLLKHSTDDMPTDGSKRVDYYLNKKIKDEH